MLKELLVWQIQLLNEKDYFSLYAGQSNGFILCLLLIEIFRHFYYKFLKAPNRNLGDNNSSLFKESKSKFFPHCLLTFLRQAGVAQCHRAEFQNSLSFENFLNFSPKNICFQPSPKDEVDSVSCPATVTSSNYFQCWKNQICFQCSLWKFLLGAWQSYFSERIRHIYGLFLCFQLNHRVFYLLHWNVLVLC